MHAFSESQTFNSNNIGNTVPNVMFDNTMPNFSEMSVRDGENLNMTNTVTMDPKMNAGHQEALPTYSVDNSIQQFEIPDPIIRRAFSRKVFTYLLIQHILMLPIIEIFIVCFEPFSYATVEGIRGVILCCLIVFYFFSDMRRYAPMNIAAFVVVTLLVAIEAGSLATGIQSQLAIFPHLIIILQILAIIAYSEQTRYKFSIINAILLVLIISIAGHYLAEIIYHFSAIEVKYGLVSFTTYRAAYIVYDMHLMLSGHHGYILQPDEYIFAATNVYADLINLFWRIFRFLIITPVVTIYKFLVGCCFAEVC
ncbi:protein lifeguard 1-like [Eurosta solidaginis]|uniref:protein lifeguard 1-like n=1 Tax=Eurosta solidaginis TaxID=178769 RepID=UPI0035307B59